MNGQALGTDSPAPAEQGQRLVNPAMSSTIFAPTDAVIVSMTRKPHQGPATADSDSDRILSTEDEQERAGYLERWVQRHVVAGGDIDLSEGVVVETLAGDGTTIRFVVDAAQAGDADGDNDNDWRKVTLLPGNAKIVDKKEVSRAASLYLRVCRHRLGGIPPVHNDRPDHASSSSYQCRDGQLYVIDGALQ